MFKKIILTLVAVMLVGSAAIYFRSTDNSTSNQAAMRLVPPTPPAQPTALLNCDSTLTITIPENAGITHYQIMISGNDPNAVIIDGGSYVTNVIVAAAPSGNTVYTTPVSIHPSLSQYAVGISRLVGNPPTGGTGSYNPINIIWTNYNADGSVTGAPAKLGYEYHNHIDGIQPVPVITCPTQSAATFITSGSTGNGNGNGNGNGGNGNGNGNGPKKGK